MKNELEVRVYVGTYAKYNDGSIFGRWLTITADTDMAEFW
jgi:antirestriction protein